MNTSALSTPDTHATPASVAPGDIAVGVVIGRASEYFDFFVYGIASVLVFPAVFFPFADRLQGTLYAFAINAVALFARLRLVVTHEYERQLELHELDPCDVGELFAQQGHNVFIGAFAALASYALFHIVTVFPLSWIMLYSEQSVGQFMAVELVGAVLAAAAMPLSGWLADRIGRRRMLGAVAVLIAAFSLLAPS